MNKLRFTSVLIIAALIVTACGSDYATDEMEPETLKVKTHAKKKVAAGGEGNVPEEEEDTCIYYLWEALDTIITEYASPLIDIHFHVACNEGFSSQLRPCAVLSVDKYGENNDSYAILEKVELGNNGQIHCFYFGHILHVWGYDDCYKIVTAQLKVKEIRVPD